ncbi:P-loop containing nucleoside triphosphate hydrolase protein, partial [Ceratobasidium sp. AG-I]
ISPTGSGKSLTFFLPFLWDKSGITLLVCPLQLLGDQHSSSTLLKKLGIQAVNLTSLTATDSVFKDIGKGVYQLIIASPEYIAEDTRFSRLWRSTNFTQWGDFWKAYRNLCFLRFILPSAVVLAVSATLPAGVLTEIKSLLGLKDDVQLIRRSNDRPNIELVVCQMQFTLRSLFDLAFLVPLGLTKSMIILPKFMLFMESKELCQKAALFLRRRLPPDLEHKVVWVHADMSRDHNQKALARLRSSEIYGVVCTDVAGMGIDIPDVELVVQYQLPVSLSVLWQRLGRAARDPKRHARGVVLVEKKHFEEDKERRRKAAETRQANKRRR